MFIANWSQKTRKWHKIKFLSMDLYSVAFFSIFFFVNSILISKGLNRISLVQVEYDIESCSASGKADNGCIDSKRASLAMPTGGYIAYGVAHQHSGGLGSALYGEVIQHLRFLFVIVAILVQHFLFSLSGMPVMISCGIS